ncbi:MULTISPECIES: TetR/AcrR family transcriptional regulator [unclassified Clostridium]|uniref:TetR/AcrR family transcriptional regulator n=1 Tax=unclassified Clostridium TaxID=2614128 RepID=UPI000E8FFED6|nr:TetR/AcrR family transcriptional regulator [Clostridium sp.]
MAKYKEISTQTRQNLIDAFWELYCEKRIEKITVREITTKAGYNRSTFYEYFNDVYDVLEQIEESLLPNIEDMPPLLPTMGNESVPIDSFIKLYSSSSKYYTVLLGDNGDPAFAGKIKNGIKAKLLEQLETSESNMEIDYTLEYMLSAMIGILTYWFKNNENISKEDLVKLMYELMNSEGINKLVMKLKV